MTANLRSRWSAAIGPRGDSTWSARRVLRYALLLREEMSAGRARRSEPGLVGGDDRLDAVAQPELAQDARHVRLDRRLAEKQALGQLGVREAAGQQAQHLELALGERGELRRRLAGRGRQRLREAVQQPARHR